MLKPIFGQAMSTFLTAALIGQFTFGSTMAMAQSPTNGNPDPFWSSAGVNSGNSNFWFNQSPNPLDPTQPSSSDPWGNWSDNGSGGWSNLGAGGAWDPNNNPYGGLGGMWGGDSSMMTNVRPTDSLPIQLMRWSGVINKNYAIKVKAKRVQYGAYSSEDNDALADKIIQEESLRSATYGAAGAMLPSLLAVLQAATPGVNGASAMYGYGTGMALGTLGDFFGVISSEANMMYSLQELYGELSSDDDERAADSILPFIVGSSGATVSNYLAKQLMITPSYPVPAPGPAPIPDPPVVPPTTFESGLAQQRAMDQLESSTSNIAASAAEKANAKKYLFAWSKSRAEKKALKTAMDRQAAELIAKNGVVEKIENMAPPALRATLKDKHAVITWLQRLPSPLRVIVASAAAFTLDYASCFAFGKLAKMHYRAKHRNNLANVVHTLRTYPAARATVWLILIRDIFPHMGDEETPEGKKVADEASRMYASILMNELPLRAFELKSILRDYHNDNKLIDKYLAALRDPLPTEVKLEMIKLIYAATLMKGFPNAHELQTTDTVAVGLGLKPPANVNTTQLKQHPEDLRMKDWARYDDLMFRMNKAANEQEFSPAKSQVNKPKGYKQAHRWRSGQIVLQDFQETGVEDINAVMDEIAKSGGLITPQIQKDVKCAANIATFQDDPWKNLDTTTGAPSTTPDPFASTPATAAPCVPGSTPVVTPMPTTMPSTTTVPSKATPPTPKPPVAKTPATPAVANPFDPNGQKPK